MKIIKQIIINLIFSYLDFRYGKSYIKCDNHVKITAWNTIIMLVKGHWIEYNFINGKIGFWPKRTLISTMYGNYLMGLSKIEVKVNYYNGEPKYKYPIFIFHDNYWLYTKFKFSDQLNEIDILKEKYKQLSTSYHGVLELLKINKQSAIFIVFGPDKEKYLYRVNDSIFGDYVRFEES